MGRTKSKTKSVTNQVTKPKKKPKATRWGFEIGEKVIYVGCAYEKYKNTEVVILEKDGKNHRNDYTVQCKNGDTFMTVETAFVKIIKKEGEINIEE